MTESLDQSAPDSLRQEVIAVALKQFRRHGFKSVTMDDIARSLGRSKKTLYTVVNNKQELIDLVIDADMAVDDCAIVAAQNESADAIDEMLRIAHHFASTMIEMNPSGLYDLQKYYRKTWERVDAHYIDGMVDHVRKNLRRGQSEGLYRMDMDRELIARLFVMAPQAFTNPDRFQLEGKQWEEVLDQFFLYHLLGVCSANGRLKLEKYLNRTPTI